MQLQNQIESINNPQEFTRLYNFLLDMEYGLDYVPIDDDQADRGNDGYLKPEKRIFAGHCFKRIQKQKINEEILEKMSSDLKKAIKLRDEAIWEVDSWTFISNYPIPETVAEKIIKIGKENKIDVSWRSADYLAKLLNKYKEAAEAFPHLVSSNIQAKLDVILDTLTSDAKEPDIITEVPSNDIDIQKLIINKPNYWSYLYFGGLLYSGRAKLNEKWLNHNLRYARPSGIGYDDEEANRQMSVIFPQLSKTIDGLAEMVNQNAAVAFGTDAQDGDEDTIRFIANRILNSYEDMLDWASRIRSSTYPKKYENVFLASADMVDQPIKDIRKFIDDVYEAGNKIISHFSGDDKGDDLELKLTLHLSIDDQDQARFNREMRKLRNRFGIF